MYPNPFSDFTTIELPPQYSGTFDIKIYDLMGREVMTKTTQTNKFELARQQLQEGVYLMEIYHNKRRIALAKLSVSN
jgi:serine protease AprX